MIISSENDNLQEDKNGQNKQNEEHNETNGREKEKGYGKDDEE